MCGTGLIDAIALMLRLGVVEDSGRFADEEDLEEPLRSWCGEEGGRGAFYLTPDHSLYITQADVRNLQLAKAAVCAGIMTMLDHIGIEASDIDSLEIAGGVGAYLNLESAACVGLFPEVLLPVAKSVGNTSGEGATALLVSGVAREREAEIVEKCEYIELSTSMTFNQLYVKLMGFA